MKVSIIHPSRGRPEQATSTISNWLKRADNPLDIQYALSLDEDDYESYAMRMKLLAGIYFNIEILVNENKSAIQAINHAATYVDNALLIVVSDDFDCPQHWDTLLLEALKDKEDFCVKTKDGYQNTMMTLPIMDRAYYNRFGYIYNPIYTHWYADQEMTAVAMMLGRNINLDIEFTHNHYMAGKGVKDAINERNNLSAASGKIIYNQRVKDNFGIEDPVIQYRDIRWR